jgi:nucleoid-associated protein YgaU
MKKYRDEIAGICHEIVKDGYRLGIVTDDEMKEFEADGFVPEPETSQTAYVGEKSMEMIKQTVSQ